MFIEEDRHSYNVAEIKPVHVYSNLPKTAQDLNNEVATHSFIQQILTGCTLYQTPFPMLGICQKTK